MTKEMYEACLKKYGLSEVVDMEYTEDEYAEFCDVDGLICLRGEQLQNAGAPGEVAREAMRYLAKTYMPLAISQVTEMLRQKGCSEEEIAERIEKEKEWYSKY